MSKPGRPNLSLAGKREAPTEQKASRGGSTPRGTRGRGRGRGAGPPRQKQELIQTGGVFSEGLGGEFPSRNKKTNDSDGSQFGYAKRDKPSGGPSSSSEDQKEEQKKSSINMDGKASFEGWDRIWQSDDEEDEAILKALRPESIVSDLKRGSLMPVVLPQEDQPQFLKVLNKYARLSLEDEEEDTKPVKIEGTTEKPKKPTAEELIAILESARKNLLHMQLPSVIATICNNFESSAAAPMEVDDPNASENPTEQDSAPEATLGLPPGQEIGQIQVTKNGRILLKIKGHSIEMSVKPVSGKQQSTILLEVDPTDPILTTPGNSRGSSFENSLYHMGNVTHNLIGSMSWGELNSKEKPEEDQKNGEMEVDEREPQSDPEIRKRLEDAQKIQAGWADDAESWAKGILNS